MISGIAVKFDTKASYCEEARWRPVFHYKRLTRFFDAWSTQEAFVHEVRINKLRVLRKLGFDKLLLDGTSWTIGETQVHYLVLSVLVKKVAVPIYGLFENAQGPLRPVRSLFLRSLLLMILGA